MVKTAISNCWLSPFGEIMTTNIEEPFHENLAKIIIEMRGEKSVKDPIEKLENEGWIRLSSYVRGSPKWIIRYNRRLNKRQEATILDWCIKNNIKFEDCFSY